MRRAFTSIAARPELQTLISQAANFYEASLPPDYRVEVNLILRRQKLTARSTT